jgi:hypothetical protein
MINRFTWLFVVLLFFTAGCKTTVHVHSKPTSIPPGQMKKMTGSKSAKAFAPGQQKKNK